MLHLIIIFRNGTIQSQNVLMIWHDRLYEGKKMEFVIFMSYVI